MKARLSKQRLAEIAGKYGPLEPDIAVVAEMAEEHRKAVRQKKAPKKRKRQEKKQLKPTDSFTPAQWARLFAVVETAPARHVTRAVLNQMLLILFVESGLRVSEICNLRLRCLPWFSGKRAIQVVDGKGKKNRTVVISQSLTDILDGYISRYHSKHPGDNYLFRSEGGGGLTRRGAYDKIKRIGVKAGLWVYLNKHGEKTTKLSPHKFRHTNASHLMEASGNIVMVKDNLGHSKTATTEIYLHGNQITTECAADAMSAAIWSKVSLAKQKVLTPRSRPNAG